MEDEKIVALYWLREESAIQETKDKYGPYLYKIAYNILCSARDSEESVNDTYLAAWNSIPPHRPSVLSTYLGKLTRRISIDMFRRKTRDKRQASEYALSLDELADCVPAREGTPEHALETQILADAVQDFLRSISEEARNLFIGRYYFLDPLRDVARYCGMSEGKAKSMLFRTRCSLRAYLEKEGFNL